MNVRLTKIWVVDWQAYTAQKHNSENVDVSSLRRLFASKRGAEKFQIDLAEAAELVGTTCQSSVMEVEVHE